MKRIVASVGLAALGAASFQTLHAQTADKPWSVAVSLRGFYDDNVNTSANNEIDTFGFDINPSVGYDWVGDQTTVSLYYAYGFKWYDKKPDPSRTEHFDQTHTFTARLMHAFTERTSVSVSDAFVIGQEPDALRSGGFASTVQRISGDNIRNYGTITLNHQFSERFGIEAGYANTYINYDQEGFIDDPVFGVITSQSGLLDRLEHSFHIDGRFTLRPTTVVLLGYMYSFSDYTGDELIGRTFGGLGDPLYSKSRNSRSHYGYAGVEHSFLADLTGSLRVGARAIDFYNAPTDESDIGPYVAASLRYAYTKDSSVQAGFNYDRHATDTFSVIGESITTDATGMTAYASLSHRILPKLTGNLSISYQHDVYEGGEFDGQADDYFLAGISFEYQINRHLSAIVGYNFDHADGDIPTHDYNRNRAYIGATFAY